MRTLLSSLSTPHRPSSHYSPALTLSFISFSHQALLSFDPQSLSLSEKASIDLPDAVVALAASGTTLYSIIGVGVKIFSCSDNTLTTHSSFRHDLRVSATQDQSAIAVSADLSALIVASDEGHVVSLSLPRYENLFSAHLHTQGVTDLAISSDATLVATTSRDRSAYIWRSRTGQIHQILKPVVPPDMRTHIRAVRFCQSNPHTIFTIESNPRKGGWIAAWQRPPDTHEAAFKPVTSLKVSADAITTFSVNTDGTLIAASSSEGHVMLLRWRGSSFSLVWSTETKLSWFSPPKSPHDLPITGLRFSKSADYFFSASADYSVAAWPIKPPREWHRARRLTLCLLNMLILLFAMLVVEDPALPSAIRHHRSTLQPYLEPHLSKVQGYVRPFIRDHQSQVQPYLIKIQDALQPPQKLPAKLMRPHVEKPREHHTLWKSKLLGTCERISRDYNFCSSSVSSSTGGEDLDQESFDDRDRKTETNLEKSSEETLIDSGAHRHGMLTNEMPSRRLEESSLNTDNPRQIHDRSDKQLYSPHKRVFIMESQPAYDDGHQEMSSFEKLLRGERTTAICFAQQARHKRSGEEECALSENEARPLKATEIIDQYANIHSEGQRGFTKSSSDPSVDESQRRVAQSRNAKKSKPALLQNSKSGSENSFGATSQKPSKRSDPSSSQELRKGSETVVNLSAMNLESSKHDFSSAGRNRMAKAESAGNKIVSQQKTVTSAGRSNVATAEIVNELMERETLGHDHEIPEPPESSSDPNREGSEETTSKIFITGENLLEEVHAGIDSILAESSHIFG